MGFVDTLLCLKTHFVSLHSLFLTSYMISTHHAGCLENREIKNALFFLKITLTDGELKNMIEKVCMCISTTGVGTLEP